MNTPICVKRAFAPLASGQYSSLRQQSVHISDHATVGRGGARQSCCGGDALRTPPSHGRARDLSSSVITFSGAGGCWHGADSATCREPYVIARSERSRMAPPAASRSIDHLLDNSGKLTAAGPGGSQPHNTVHRFTGPHSCLKNARFGR